MKKIKVALLVDEYFGALGTAYGGYGFLARRYVAKYLPNEEFQVDVLLGKSRWLAKKHVVDGVNVYYVPKKKIISQLWFNKQKYDVFLSVELTGTSFEILSNVKVDKKLILWIQDPRPWYEWREIETVKMFQERSYWDSRIYEFVHSLHEKGKVYWISQGLSLNDKARDLYRLSNDTLISYIPNPIDIDNDFNLEETKKDKIIFLGRIESVKRGWLFCEIAKRLPKYDFYMLGATFRESRKNSDLMERYKTIENLHLVGHVDGDLKKKYLREAKILVNTSIHEAIPISFLEALSYGALLVSNRNPENLTSNFGQWVGDVLGEGFDQVDLFVQAIENLMSNPELMKRKSREAVDYIKRIHDREKVIDVLRSVIKENL